MGKPLNTISIMAIPMLSRSHYSQMSASQRKRIVNDL
jgi:hypothetical protein